MTRERGTVKAVFSDRAFGFIKREGKSDVFFHVRQNSELLIDSALTGRDVEFTVQESAKGPVAVDAVVVPIEG